MRQENDWTPNTDRLVRSAMGDERYCSFILDCLHTEQLEWSLTQLESFWARAAESDLSVSKFIAEARS